jgi:hypothetical protein
MRDQQGTGDTERRDIVGAAWRTVAYRSGFLVVGAAAMLIGIAVVLLDSVAHAYR